MIRQNVDRRTALVTLCATLAGSALTWLGLRPEHPDVVTQQPASYVPPTTWDHLNPIVRGTFLAIDSLVYQAEQQGQVAQVQAIAQSIMAMPGQDAGKMYVVRYVTDAPKPAYLMPLLFGLDPSLSGPEVRRLIIAAPERILTKVGPSAVPSVCRVALQTYQTSGFETDPTTTGLLARVISSLIQAGI